MTRPVVDAAPLSEFVRKMRAVFIRREAARTVTDKRAIEREMEALMRQYLGRSAWDALADAEGVAQPSDVSRDTSTARSCHATGDGVGAVEGKVAAAGKDAD